MKRILYLVIVLTAVSTTGWSQDFPKLKCSAEMGTLMFKGIDTADKRGVADNHRTWENGQVLLVKFMPGGSKTIRDKVIQTAKEWEKYANIIFKFVPDTTSLTNIRVKLGKGIGHNSAVGTDANIRPQTEPTMNFDTLNLADHTYYLAKIKAKGIPPPYNWNHLIAAMREDPNHWNDGEFKRVVTHEFGHSLGLLHEQSYPGAVKWKKTDSVYNYYRETQGWDKAKVDFNVFEVSNQFYTNGTTYDPKSIMHYAIQPWETWDGYSIKDNFEISAGDKVLIAALYPKNKKYADRLVPKIDVSSFTKVEVINNTAKGGLSIYPSFDLKTNAKLGKVYLVARLATEDGYYVKTSSLYYNWGGAAASYMKMNLLPNSRVSYNKGKKNLELFLPYNQIPELFGRRIIVAFAVYLDDEENGQMDILKHFSTTNPLSITK